MLTITERGPIVEWRGPAPHHFLPLSEENADRIHAIAPAVTYGWGVIPVRVRIGSTSFTTSLFPLEGTYLVPLKASVRAAEGLELGSVVEAEIEI